MRAAPMLAPAMRRLLVVASSLDLSAGFGCTSAWWQLLRALRVAGADLVCTTYQGPAIASPWWRIWPNPCRREGDLFAALRRRMPTRTSGKSEGAALSPVARAALAARIRPRWRSHLAKMIESEGPIDAVLLLNVPPNHIAGIAEDLGKKYGVPFWFYDGDVPASFPEFGGYDTGFQIYPGARLEEFAGVICNSEGGCDRLRQMGARRVEVLHWAADPELFAPRCADPEVDVFFYGIGARHREEWIEKMLRIPSEQLPEVKFRVAGAGFTREQLGRCELVPPIPLAQLPEACGKAKIVLSITRMTHAETYATSSCRYFELAAMGCCVATNPVAGMERWFNPGKDLTVIAPEARVAEIYRELLSDGDKRKSMADSIRRRAIDEHTYIHRARRLLEII